MQRRRLALFTALTFAALAAAGCGTSGSATPETTRPRVEGSIGNTTATAQASTAPTGAGKKITVYSGRSEKLVAPLFQQFTAATGIEVSVRYAGSAELAAQIAEEAGNSPADVFFSQDAGALGALGNRSLLAPMPPASLNKVDRRFRSDGGDWVGVSGRARVIVANPKVPEPSVPDSVFDLTATAWRGRVGIAPTNASFQSFVTGMRVTNGDSATRQWLGALKANGVKIYEGNALIVKAASSGEIDLGLVNHYYVYEVRKELGPEAPLAVNHFLTGGDPGALVNVAGVGILASSKNKAGAERFVEYLLAAEAQTYFAEKTFEYPLITGVAAAPGLTALSSIQSPDIDLSDLSTLEETLTMLAEVGLL